LFQDRRKILFCISASEIDRVVYEACDKEYGRMAFVLCVLCSAETIFIFLDPLHLKWNRHLS
jgi:hypothetical protein